MSAYKVVLHVDAVGGFLKTALTNAVNFAIALPGEELSLVLVVNGPAVTQLADKNIWPDLTKAAEAGLCLRVCNNALRSTETRPESLFPQSEVVPAGIVELVRLQQQGYAYIKP